MATVIFTPSTRLTMRVVTVNTTQNVVIDYPIAGVLDRIVAYIIDALIMAAYLFLIFFIIISVRSGSEWTFVFFYFPVFFYSLAFEILMDGQTPGKKAMNLKVVRLDGTSPTIGNYILRWLLKLIDVSFTWGSVAITSILITQNGQRLGDLAAGTTVIKLVKAGDTTGQQIMLNLDESYTPEFPQVVQLSDKDIDLIKEALEVNRTLGNMSGVLALDAKLKEHLGIQTDMPPIKFLYTVLKDYSHLTSAM
jgi:uncharacterized RDD family membrane protein YckC